MAEAPLPFRPIATAPRTGHGILCFGRHTAESSSRADPRRGQLRAGDPWWSILLWDVWREPSQWVFAKDGTPAWSEPTHWLELTEPGETVLVFPRELTPELRDVLGTPNFKASPIAWAFRDAGLAEIPAKAEAEQAFVLHWLTALALEHGPDWRSAAGHRLEAAIAAAKVRRPVTEGAAP